MNIGKKVRGCDQFGAQVHLFHEGEAYRGTMCGGAVSVCMGALILAYLCYRSLVVAVYDDSSVSSYTIREDRALMKTPISYGDYDQELAYGFLDNWTLKEVPLDARICSFELVN